MSWPRPDAVRRHEGQGKHRVVGTEAEADMCPRQAMAWLWRGIARRAGCADANEAAITNARRRRHGIKAVLARRTSSRREMAEEAEVISSAECPPKANIAEAGLMLRLRYRA